jgi:hypothetical protein
LVELSRRTGEPDGRLGLFSIFPLPLASELSRGPRFRDRARRRVRLVRPVGGFQDAGLDGALNGAVGLFRIAWVMARLKAGLNRADPPITQISADSTGGCLEECSKSEELGGHPGLVRISARGL